MSGYGGEDRRQISRDHDLLLEIKGIVTAHKEYSERQFYKQNEDFLSHVSDDKHSFERVWKSISGLKWYAAMGTGILVALEFASKFILK